MHEATTITRKNVIKKETPVVGTAIRRTEEGSLGLLVSGISVMSDMPFFIGSVGSHKSLSQQW